MLTCNVSNVSSILFNHTSSHDSHTEVHQPASISNSTTSHHTSPGHHLYEGDLVSKTSNLLNEFSISSNWDLGLDFSGGGEKKIGCPIPQSKLFFVFSSPPLSRGGARQGHHTSPGHHLYEGDLVSKTSNLNEFSISSNWGLGLGFSMGGRKKEELVAHSHEQFFFFIPPPPGEEAGRPSCWRLRTHWDWRSWRQDPPHRGDDLMIYDVMSWTCW